MPHRRRAGLFLVALLATLLLLVVPAWAAPLLSLSQSSASPGDTIGVSGSGFAADTTLKLCWDGDTCADLGRPRTDAEGFFATTVSIPPDATAGSHTIWACGAECASASLLVVVPDPPTTTTLLPPSTTLVASTTTLLPLTTTTFPATSTTLVPLTTTTLRTAPPLPTTSTVAKSTTTTARATTTTLPTTTTVVAGSLPTTTTRSPSPGQGATDPTTTTTSPAIGSKSFDRPFNEDSHRQPEAEVLGDSIVGESGALEFAGSARTDSPATSNSLPNWLWIALIPVEIGLLAFIINSVVREVRRY